MFDLKGKKILVTGATRGIGFAIAKCLSDFGAMVFVNGTDEERVKKAVSQIPNSIGAVCDLSLENCAEILYEKTGDIDILVSNASVQIRRAWDEITSEEFDKQMTVNFKSPFKLIQKYVPYMKEKRWGRVITIGSIQEARPHKDMVVYGALKSAQTAMVMNLSKQFAPYGITVNNVAPGVIDTSRNEEALSDEEYRKKILDGIPCGYVGEPEDCAAQVLLLCSEEGRYITGESIFVDGGMKL